MTLDRTLSETLDPTDAPTHYPLPITQERRSPSVSGPTDRARAEIEAKAAEVRQTDPRVGLAAVICLLRPDWSERDVYAAIADAGRPPRTFVPAAIAAALDPELNQPRQVTNYEPRAATYVPRAPRCPHGLPLDAGTDRGIACRTCLRQTLAEQTAAEARERRSGKRASLLDDLANRTRCACGQPASTVLVDYDAGLCRTCAGKVTA